MEVHHDEAPPLNEHDNTHSRNEPITDLKDAASHAEYNTIMNVLKQVKFNKTKAAAVLKIDRKTLYNKIRQYEDSIIEKQ